MAANEVRHPIIVDTDALIAVANTSLWERITENLQLTTTNVCYQELKRHLRETREHAPEDTREQRLHTGSERALKPFADEDNEAFTVVSCVPRPHGEDAGEESLKREIEQHPETYRFAILMDADGRRSINRVFEKMSTGKAVAPTFLLYLLFDRGMCSEREFCEACAAMLRAEGWLGYQAIQAAWEAIPIDCTQYLPDDVLPTS